jgi:hypothetical protein
MAEGKLALRASALGAAEQIVGIRDHHDRRIVNGTAARARKAHTWRSPLAEHVLVQNNTA